MRRISPWIYSLRECGDLSKELSESDIIKLSLVLYPEDMQNEIKEDVTVLMGAVHLRNPYRNENSRHKVMFGELMAYETLWKLGRWLNKEYPEG